MTQQKEQKQGHGDLNSAISEARNFASRIEEIEVELEQQVEELAQPNDALNILSQSDSPCLSLSVFPR